mmetsp:Transcript_26723/g.44147  ORF Transcript_26723/g.44147 Transcript_26723/m.44147 type:complete len:1003 (-) Transcript_26723:215-3223(-)
MVCTDHQKHKAAAAATTSSCCNGNGHANRQPDDKFDTRLRNFFIRTNVDLFIIGLAVAIYQAPTLLVDAAETGTVHESAAFHGDGDSMEGELLHQDTTAAEHETQETEIRSTYAVLFPWFAQILGVFVYFLLSRYAHALPYTAVMFIIGLIIGFAEHRHDSNNAIHESTATWLQINGELILLIFLPGLLYLESYNIDIHLFIKSFNQILVMAFPMVLAGTTLTACVAYYIFPYGWSFDLCMAFGSILSATDPVAVAVLLNELGAPPRLKMHIGGESLMNDGSAVVFYVIFRDRFFYTLGVPDVGSDIGWAEGFKLFFRLSLGGMCIGLAFGLGTVFLLYKLKRRLSGEDSVVQVVVTISSAYLCFFTSEILSTCSGIIAVVFLGVTVKTLGESMMNDKHLMHHFWEIAEWLLNTLLFTFAGVEYGAIISDNQDTAGVDALFTAKDWGYLFLLFVLLLVIRLVLLVAFYPINSNIGIGSSWREMIFMWYGGLRGAVGIALAIALNAEVWHFTHGMADVNAMHEYRVQSSKLFGFVGGIAMLTLIINAPTCGPLLRKLGLVDSTETQLKVIDNYRQLMVYEVLKEYVAMLSESRFRDLDFSVVREHVSCLQSIDYEALQTAISLHKKETPPSQYEAPYLKNIIPYLYKRSEGGEDEADVEVSNKGDLKEEKPLEALAEEGDVGEEETNEDDGPDEEEQVVETAVVNTNLKSLKNYDRTSLFDLRVEVVDQEAHEERLVFIKLIRNQYHKLIEDGEVDSRGFIPYSLLRSLDFAEDEAHRGLPLNDWDTLKAASDSFAKPIEAKIWSLAHYKRRLLGKNKTRFDRDYFELNLQVRQVFAFVKAHEMAAKVFKKGFLRMKDDKGLQRKGSLTSTEKVILDECSAQIALAMASLEKLNARDVALSKSHYACDILLHKAASYFSQLSSRGLMTQRDASEFVSRIEKELFNVSECQQLTHTDELDASRKKSFFADLTKSDLNVSITASGFITMTSSATTNLGKSAAGKS